MNKQFALTVKAFESANGSYGKAIALLRTVVGNADDTDIKHAVSQEKQWQAFLTSPEYKAGTTAAQDLMRKSMQRIRAKSGYTADRKGVISAKKTVVRGTKERADEVKAKPVAKELAVHSIASPTEAAKVVSAISTWRAAIDAVINAFDSDLPEEVKDLLLKASFFKVAPKAKAKA